MVLKNYSESYRESAQVTRSKARTYPLHYVSGPIYLLFWFRPKSAASWATPGVMFGRADGVGDGIKGSHMQSMSSSPLNYIPCHYLLYFSFFIHSVLKLA